jgi:hypothetical protein
MKDVFPLVSFLVLGLFLSFLQFASLLQNARNAATASQQAAKKLDNAQDAKTFLGQVLQVDGKFVLCDSASNETYLLDDQKMAKPFDGRIVKVIGMLDAPRKTIHIL